jgi:hypothetical protein
VLDRNLNIDLQLIEKLDSFEESSFVDPNEYNSTSYDQQFAHDRRLLIKGGLLSSIATRDRGKFKNMQQSRLIIR